MINKDNSNHPTFIWGPFNNNYFVKKYRVYRQIGFNTELIFESSNSSTFTYTDYNLSLRQLMPNNGYNYYVCALDSSDIESSPTNSVTVTGLLNFEKSKPKDASQNQPGDFFLFQNYPNPFNPTSLISFNVPYKSLIQLKVYDVLGRELQTLFDGLLTEGNYSYLFNGKNLASGVYYYTLKTGNYTMTKKMILTI